uniref:LsmAD domain-containing protein n=1 Tax=Electrophorus electricus TaxID=8005 RepID=A0A4W4E1E7_ELEEL
MSFRRQNQQSGPGGRKTSNGTSGSASMSSTVPGSNTTRSTPGRNRNSVKPPSQSSPVFEGIYNNSRMLHFLTAVVGCRCDVRVKNGTVYEGIFKTLSSRCELAVDAVHKIRVEDGEGCGGGTSTHPRREEITDTMIFSPSDLITMTCRDVDLNYATRDTFTDATISSSRVNGDHREKVLQRWDGGDSNGENYDLDTDTSNGWDATEMFRFNEETYGVKSTYDASLSMYTVPLERGTSEGYRQREARAARLASEIESSSQYRHRVALENDEGRSEEEKYSAVVRDGGERERGRDSPGFPSSGSRSGKYIPLPQRAREREMGVSRGDRERGGSSSLPNRTNRPTPSSSSPRPSLPSGSSQPAPPSDRNGPLSIRGGYSPHQSQCSPPAHPRTMEPGHTSPPAPHMIPHSLSHPQSLSDSTRPVNGGKTSPKSQRPAQTRSLRSSNSHSSPTVSHSPKPDAHTQDSLPQSTHTYLDTSAVTMVTPKPSGPTPLFPVDVNEILSKERTDSPASPQEGKSNKAPSVQQRSQIEELRKFGKEFRLQSASSPSSPSAAATPSDPPQPSPAHSTQADPSSSTELKTASPTTPTQEPLSNEASREASTEGPAPPTPTPVTPTATPAPTPGGAPQPSVSDGQVAAVPPQPARTPGREDSRAEAGDRDEGVADQVKKSTLNPNAKEFNPIKAPLTMVKPSATPTPRPTPPSPSVVLQPPAGQGAIYGHQYLRGHRTPFTGSFSLSGSVVGPRPDHSSTAPPMIQTAASAAGPPLVASPYTQSYLQYSQVIPAMPHYPGQPVYSMLQGGARMLSSGGHPQTLGPPGPQYPGQSDGPPGAQQGMYTPQTFSHPSGSMHPPQPSSTPTGSQPPPQHPAPSPGQSAQSGPQPQALYHSGPLSAPTPPNLPPGHSSPQASYSLQSYSLPGHQPLPHPYSSIGQLTQAHVSGALSGPHPSGGHGPPPMMLLHAPPPPPPQQGAHQHYTFIGHHQAMQVQPHPSQQIPFHPPGN